MIDSFSIEILYRPWIPYNIVNWRIFDDDQQLINFLHLEDTFKDSIIHKGQYDLLMNIDNIDSTEDNNVADLNNNISRCVFGMENLYDLQEKLKEVRNYKNNNSYMHFEVVNLGSDITP